MDIDYEKLRKIAAVSHLNFLFGAGASRDYLPILGDIEDKMDKAGSDDAKLYAERKRYFNEVMLPSSNILGKTEGYATELAKTYENYQSFFKVTVEYLLKRKSTLLDKQVSIFTTNIDIFMEKVLEDMGLNFNDGFSGRIKPEFNTSNFLTVIKKKSEHFNKQSEIPTFNIYKLHGSLTWMPGDNDEIIYSDLSNISELRKVADKQEDFSALYQKLQIVNPSSKKFETTLIEYTYYEMLRLYSTALENEQSLLFVIGFSFADKHILKMTKRAIDSNPTLSVCIFSHSQDGIDTFKKMFENTRYSSNVYVIGPQKPEDKLNLEGITKDILKEVFSENDGVKKEEEPK